MEKSNLDRLIERYVTGEATEEERVKLEAWLDVMKTKESRDRELSPEDEERIFQQLTGRIRMAEESIASQTEEAQGRRYSRWGYFRLAAASILLVIAAYVTWFNAPDAIPSPYEFTARKDVEKVLLEDGTLVWLRRNSTITFRQTEEKSERLATLAGEALFEVAKDPTRPFLITCSKVTVKVVGTSFNLRSTDSLVELKVLTGKVNVTTAEDEKGVMVLPNEVVIYKDQDLSEKKMLTASDKNAITANTGYNMNFENISIAQIAERIEEKFDVKIKIEQDHLRGCRVTGDFTDYSLDSTLRTLTELLDVQYLIEGQSISLKGNGCQ